MYPFAEKYSGDGIFLNSNINPFGPPPLATREMRKAIKNVNFYPEEYEKFKRILLEKLKGEGLDVRGEDDLVLGNGSDEVIELTIRFLDRKHLGKLTVIVAEGVFPFYEYSAKALGVKLEKVKLLDFGYDAELLLRTARRKKPSLICVSHPINPTGKIISADEYAFLIKEVGGSEGIYLLSDEAYFEYAHYLNGKGGREKSQYISAFSVRVPGVFVSRTFSKAYGLAGVRLGYLISEYSSEIEKEIKQPFNVNSIALAAGRGALRDTKFLQKTLKNNFKMLEKTEKFFTELGIQYVKSWANFIFFRAPKSGIYRDLMRKKIFIRDMSKYGFPGFYRVSMGKEKEMNEFMKIFRKNF